MPAAETQEPVVAVPSGLANMQQRPPAVLEKQSVPTPVHAAVGIQTPAASQIAPRAMQKQNELQRQMPIHAAASTEPAGEPSTEKAALTGQVAALLKAIQVLQQQEETQQMRLMQQQQQQNADGTADGQHEQIKRQALGRLLEKAAHTVETNAENKLTSPESAAMRSSVHAKKPVVMPASSHEQDLGDASQATLKHIRDEIDAILTSRRVHAPQHAVAAGGTVTSAIVHQASTQGVSEAEGVAEAEPARVAVPKAEESSLPQGAAVLSHHDLHTVLKHDIDTAGNSALMRPLRAARPGSVASEADLKQALQELKGEVHQLETKEQKLLDSLPSAEERVERAKAAVADTDQTLAIARNRLVLARRAAEDAESSVSEPVNPTLLQAEGAALEDEQRVADELQRQRGRLREAEAVAAEAPALARVLARRRKELDAVEERYKRMELLDEAQALEANKNFAA